MEAFTRLFLALDQSTKTNAKLQALTDYLAEAEEGDQLWALALLSGKRPKSPVRSGDLRLWAAELTELPLWLFEETYHTVGDLAETIAKILPPPSGQSHYRLSEWMEQIQTWHKLALTEKKTAVLEAWDQLDTWQRFAFNKLLMGGYRVGVSQKLMLRAMARHTGKDEAELAHRLMGQWDPATVDYHSLLLAEKAADEYSRPYPFYLAYALEGEPAQLGEPTDWQAEDKWDGIRGQLIYRGGESFLWSRGEELITAKFPELAALGALLPEGTVLDGEILGFKEGQILPFQALQKRIGRKTLGPKILAQAPVVMRAYDLLEYQGQDLRARPLAERRALLENLLALLPPEAPLQLSAAIDFDSWDALAAFRQEARERKSEGLMLKDRRAPYGVGRKKGAWWKWKLEPLTIDAVLIYAMRGHGRRANLYTDYSFALWHEGELVPIAKAYSGLTDAEFRKVDAFVKQNTLERFGPVRQVKPELVFELAFEGIQVSKRHKSGIALRFPRMKRWRQDKKAEEANQLAELEALLVQWEQGAAEKA